MIKKIPICPFCDKEMVKGLNRIMVPTELNSLGNNPTLLGVLTFDQYKYWHCGGCGFVALWDG